MSAHVNHTRPSLVWSGPSAILDDPTCAALYQACADQPRERTLVLVLADALQEHGHTRGEALRAACVFHRLAGRARAMATAADVIREDNRRGVFVRGAVRRHARVMSDRVPIDIVWGWAKPHRVGRVGGDGPAVLSPQTGRYVRPYRRSTLRVIVGCWRVIAAARWYDDAANADRHYSRDVFFILT